MESSRSSHSLRGGSPIADGYLYNGHIPGEPLNSSGVDDPKLTEMIKQQRRTLDAAKRREIVYDIQRYLAEQVYYAYDGSFTTVAAWEPYVRNFAPNLGHDYGGPARGRVARPLSGGLTRSGRCRTIARTVAGGHDGLLD